MTHKIFNASNVLGSLGLLALLAAVGTVEENAAACIALTAVFAGCTYLAAREDGAEG